LAAVVVATVVPGVAFVVVVVLVAGTGVVAIAGVGETTGIGVGAGGGVDVVAIRVGGSSTPPILAIRLAACWRRKSLVSRVG
jgi:hypothetical protein